METRRRGSLPLAKQFSGLGPAVKTIDVKFHQLCEIKRIDDDRLGVSQDTVVDPANRGVKFKAAARTFPEPFGLVREYIDNALKNREAKEEDCENIARIQAVLEKAMTLTSKQTMTKTKDDRLERCAAACEQFVAVLEDKGWAAKVREAKSREDQRVESEVEEMYTQPSPTSAAQENGAVEVTDTSPFSLQKETGGYSPQKAPAITETGSNPGSPQAMVPTRSSQESLPLPSGKTSDFLPRYVSQPMLNSMQRHELLHEIDDTDDQNEALPRIYMLFRQYSDKYLQIEGENLEKLLDDLTSYVQKEWSERNERLVSEGKIAIPDPTEDFVRNWILTSIDVDGNRCITENEAYVGFRKVVDDID